MSKEATLERFKREAKRLKKSTDLTHTEALDQLAKEVGFSNYRHLLNEAEVMTEKFYEAYPQLMNYIRIRKENL